MIEEGEEIADTKYDFLQPEFLNILFFQQKSLVIFPYVDIKHLTALEVFTEGYSLINIDATALYNISSVISHEVNQSYSRKPVYYFIVNATKDIIKDVMRLPNIHCIINTAENVESLAEGNQGFIFYNKKSKQFVNYDPERIDLSYEKDIIERAKDEHTLLQTLKAIHNTAAQLHTAIGEPSPNTKFPLLLESYHSSVWEKIFQLTAQYYTIELPEIPIPNNPKPQVQAKKRMSDFSEEYQTILRSNRKIGQEFIQALHEYRLRKVNPAHLEIEQLFYPEKLYTYLRNHHWERGIPQEFVDEWVLMKNTGYSLTEEDLDGFQVLFQALNLSFRPITLSKPKKIDIPPQKVEDNVLPPNSQDFKGCTVSKGTSAIGKTISLPTGESFPELKEWMLASLKRLEKIVFSR